MNEYPELKNFTAFNSIAIEFSPRVNVIIVENGSGKTQLPKAAVTVLARRDGWAVCRYPDTPSTTDHTSIYVCK